jgi:glutamate-1-semialdehyde aminotransferase
LPRDFTWLELVALLSSRPDLLSYNRQKKWRVGALADLRAAGEKDEKTPSSGANGRYQNSNAFFRRALETIPLASQTFSKSYQQYVLGAAPLFLARGKGARVEDIDGNGYIDYVSGLLSTVLGYCDPDVDAAIIRQLENGISFSLATRLEAELSETLRRLIPCCEMARFGKNGSDATTAAIRLARAHTGRSKVIACGYHGWHDWYIGTTTRRLGVPAEVQALTVSVPFGDANPIEALLKAAPDAFAAIILEPAGGSAPPPGYLEALRALSDRYGVVLIFDEIITGFRIHLGGAQTFYGVTPDLASFGKAMGNGMPISAVVGRKEIMRRMEDIFFSTTFGGEALSLAAAIATINKLEAEELPSKLWQFGDDLASSLNGGFAEFGFKGVAQFVGDGWWPRIKLTDPPVPANLFASRSMRMAFSLAHPSTSAGRIWSRRSRTKRCCASGRR